MEGRELPTALAEARTLLGKHLWLVYIRSPFLYKQGFWGPSTWRHTGKTISAIALPVLERERGPARCQAGEDWFFWIVPLQSSSSTNTQTCEGAREGLRIERDEASFWELPLPLRHRNMCYSLPLWQTTDNMTLPTYTRLPAGRLSLCLSASSWSNLPHSHSAKSFSWLGAT